MCSILSWYLVSSHPRQRYGDKRYVKDSYVYVCVCRDSETCTIGVRYIELGSPLPVFLALQLNIVAGVLGKFRKQQTCCSDDLCSVLHSIVCIIICSACQQQVKVWRLDQFP